MKNIQDGGEAILEALRNLRVEYVISSPGSEWPSLWEALARQKNSGTPGPTYLDCGHEILAVAMATGYTQVTGRMQVVLLHAGAGLLQGSMAIYGARTTATPMLVMSGETIGYGEGEFDPGPQWYRSLSVVGGPQRSSIRSSRWRFNRLGRHTLPQRRARRRTRPAHAMRPGVSLRFDGIHDRGVGEARGDASRRNTAQLRPPDDDIAKVAADLLQARSPFILVESAGSDQDTFDALVKLADLLAIPVIDAPGACLSNFPKSHDLYLGLDQSPISRKWILCFSSSTGALVPAE